MTQPTANTNTNHSLADRVFLVTGATGAIGFATASAIHAAGGKVALTDITPNTETYAARIDATGERAIGVMCDVTQPDSAHAAVAKAVAHFGSLHGLVNNAGIIQMNSATDATAAEWQAHFNVNTTGALTMCQAFWQALMSIQSKATPSKSRGSIVNVASNCGKVGYPNMAAYNASKAALISLTRSLSMEWARDNINVNAVCPGGVETNMLEDVASWLSDKLETPADALLADMGAAQIGRKIQPSEVAAVICFLLSDDAYIIRGQSISIDAGDTPY